MRILFALPGLHRFNRGAEVAFISIANELAATGDSVTLIGSGTRREDVPYRFLHAGSVPRQHFKSCPSLPGLRNEFAYEDLTFLPNLLLRFRPNEYDVTLTCSFPFTNWALRRPSSGARRPPHVFVTQNGDWPAYAGKSEFRFFGCEGLVCINPDYFERNQQKWRCALIPNGVDCDRFQLGAAQRSEFGIPEGRFVVLMVSALDPTKRVAAGIEAVSKIPDAHMVVAGDGALRREIDSLAAKLLPERYTRLQVSSERMPALYQSADLFLHLFPRSNRSEMFTFEAMAFGLPIVGYNSSRNADDLGDDEYLVGSDDPVQIAVQIGRARAEPTSKRQTRARRATDFSWNKITQKYRIFLQSVVTSRTA